MVGEEIKISDMMVKDERTIWVKYIDDFEVELRYLSRSQLNQILERSQTTKWDKRTHLATKEADRDTFYTKFIEKVMVSWRGLTAITLTKMLPIKVEDPNVEIPFSSENAFTLMSNAYDFDVFIQNVVTDLDQFERKRIEAEKKT